MIKTAPKANYLLAVLLVVVTAFLLCAGSVSAKSALGLQDLKAGESWEIALVSDCLRWENRLPCRSAVLENSDGPEGNLNANAQPNQGTQSGAVDAELGSSNLDRDPNVQALRNQDFNDNLNARVELEARKLVASGNAKGPALSRAGVPGSNVVSESFLNIPGSPKKFDGIERFSVDQNLDSFRVVDTDSFIAQVEKSFTDAGQKLNPAIRQRILDTVADGATLSTKNGIPGLHAEVQAVNSLLNRFPELKISDTTTSTFRLDGSNEAFPACNNCSGILNDSNIVTGRKGQ